MAISAALTDTLLKFQRTEITEYHIYLKLADVAKSADNQKVFTEIANGERSHYQFWRGHTGQDVRPDRLKMWLYYLISRLLGVTFGVKLMERGEEAAQASYAGLQPAIPDVDRLVNAEKDHEIALIGMLDEPALRYTGSIVLGLNDALVELTGALAGLTLALQDARLIALTGTITGIAAALSMATSEYLSVKTEGGAKNPLRAALYTGATYIVTVVALILPYLLLGNLYLSLACTLLIALVIIAAFNYYISVAKDLSFKARFVEMAGLSLSVASISFLIGYLVRILFGVEGG